MEIIKHNSGIKRICRINVANIFPILYLYLLYLVESALKLKIYPLHARTCNVRGQFRKSNKNENEEKHESL